MAKENVKNEDQHIVPDHVKIYRSMNETDQKVLHALCELRNAMLYLFSLFSEDGKQKYDEFFIAFEKFNNKAILEDEVKGEDQ